MAVARRESELTTLCAEIERSGGKASYLTCDVSDPGAAADTVRKADQELGSLDMVIANAGVGGNKHSTRLEPKDINAMIDINVRGAMATLVAAIPIMLAQKHGQLVGVTSLAGRRALPTSAIYSASKAALSVFLEALAMDLGPAGIDVSDVQPGFVDTPLTKKNTFPMPFLWDAPKAARHIADRLEKRARVVAFPLPMDFVSGLSKYLPFPLYSLITKRMAPR